ncbi:MAG: hypothetical protein M1826_001167 [Phylliscum demangeonii]|nr:MAG: hypothetical protein M1826_001167 [Phylliscum demangeonii]
MYSPKQMVASLLLASLLAAHHVHGSPSPREPKTRVGYPIDEVPHALRTPFVVDTADLVTLSPLGRLGKMIRHPEPHPQLQPLLGPQEHLRPQYFMWEAEKKWQLTLIYRGMMEDTDFLECMAPCMNLPTAGFGADGPALRRTQTSGHRLALPNSKPWARLGHSLQSWEHAVQTKIPSLEREVFAGEQRVGGL